MVIQSVQCCQSIAENLGLVCLQQLASLCITSEPNLTNLQENKPHGQCVDSSLFLYVVDSEDYYRWSWLSLAR